MTNSINKIASLEKEDVEIIDDNSDIDGDIDVIDCSVKGNVPLVLKNNFTILSENASKLVAQCNHCRTNISGKRNATGNFRIHLKVNLKLLLITFSAYFLYFVTRNV